MIDYSAQRATWDTRQDAQRIADSMGAGTYFLAHGEYQRPVYQVRKVMREDRYYVHVTYYYYPGTFYARESGPLLWREIPDCVLLD